MVRNDDFELEVGGSNPVGEFLGSIDVNVVNDLPNKILLKVVCVVSRYCKSFNVYIELK